MIPVFVTFLFQIKWNTEPSTEANTVNQPLFLILNLSWIMWSWQFSFIVNIPEVGRLGHSKCPKLNINQLILFIINFQ